MPTSCRGRASSGRFAAAGTAERGITLLELVVVVALVGLIAGISFPSVSSGLDSLRLSSAGDAAVAFLNGALNRAERRQEVIEVSILPKENTIALRSTDPAFERRLELPEGVRIEGEDPPQPRRFLLFPGSTVPRIAVPLVNRRGARRLVQVDPITGVPQITTP